MKGLTFLLFIALYQFTTIDAAEDANTKTQTYPYQTVKNLRFNEVIGRIINRVNKLPNETTKGDARSTCRRVTFTTDVSWGYKGCRKKIIRQTHCQGQCTSMFLPASNPHFVSCTSCAITKRRYKTVKLFCVDGVRKLKVGMAEECKCVRCNVNFTNNIPQMSRARGRRQGDPSICDYEKKKKIKRKRIEIRRKRRTEKKDKKGRKHKRRNRTKLNRCKKNQQEQKKKGKNKKNKKRKTKSNVETNSVSKATFTYADLMRLMSS